MNRIAAPVGHLNVVVAWNLIVVGLLAGAVMGIWSFGGPVPAPPGFTSYDSLPRRLVRLAHIAAIALPVLNLLYVRQLESCSFRRRTQELGCRLLLLGTLLLPALLAGSAWWPPLKYAMALPVTALIAAFLVPATDLARPYLGPHGG